jgi:hypothetical protein
MLLLLIGYMRIGEILTSDYEVGEIAISDYEV